MTNAEQIQIEEMYSHYNYKCFLCDERATQRAHIIGDTLLNKKLYGNRIISNPLDWLPVCNLAHNKKIDIGRNSVLAKEIIIVIDSMDDYEDKRAKIEDIVMQNIRLRECKL